MWINNDIIMVGGTCIILIINSYLMYKRSEFSYEMKKIECQITEKDDSLDEYLEYYYQLFNKEIEKLNRFVTLSFEKDSLTYIKFQTIIEKMKNVFDYEINSANNLFISNLDELNPLCNEKIERLERIIETVKQLNIEFIKNQNKKDENGFEEVIMETGKLKSSIKDYNLKPQYSKNPYNDIYDVLKRNGWGEKNEIRIRWNRE